MPQFAFDVIHISARINAKINSDHGVSGEDVADATDRVVAARWDTDSDGNPRLYVKGRCGAGRLIFVSLYPAGAHGEWNLATAFPIA